jgi:spermidine synthase
MELTSTPPAVNKKNRPPHSHDSCHGLESDTSNQSKTLALLFFFLSGFSALLYEVAWLSRIQLVMGHTVYSLATTLSAYLSGLALGAYLAGRLLQSVAQRASADAASSSQPIPALSLYIIAEALVGAYGLIFTLVLSLALVPYGLLVSQTQLPLPVLSAVQFVVCSIVIAVPTALMGTTLPFMVQAFQDRGESVGQSLPKLYAINTFGALAGCLAAGFLLLPNLGYQRVILLAAAINLVILVAAAFVFDNELMSFRGVGQVFRRLRTMPFQFGLPTLGRPGRAATAVLFVSGAASMLVQILWNRLTALVFGPSTYVFPLVTAVVLFGIVLGAVFARRLLRKHGNQSADQALASLPAVAALALLLGDLALTRMPLLVLSFHQFTDWGFWALSGFQFAGLLVCALFPAALLGALFPIATARLCGEGQEPLVGYGTAVNIIGLVVGALLGSFVIVPFFGIEFLHRALVLSLFALSAALAAYSLSRPLAAAGLLLLAAVTHFAAPAFNWDLLTAGYFYNRSPRMTPDRLSNLGYTDVHDFAVNNATNLVAHRDDPHATVSIHQSRRDRDELSFKINGKVDGNNTSDLQTTRFVAWLPALVHPYAQSALTIGLGTGNTAGQTLRYPNMKRSLVVELSTAMVDFAERYFFPVSNGLWTDPRAQVVIRDGRDYLANGKEKFDVIISEPSNPWVEGVGSLFTVEYYKQVANRLAPGGVASLWFHTYGLDCLSVKSVLKAAAEVFETIYVFKLGSDLYMLASNDSREKFTLKPMPEEFAAMEQEMLDLTDAPLDMSSLSDVSMAQARRRAYERMGKNTYLFDKSYALRYVEGSDANTDDNQILQFRSGRSYYTGIACRSVSYDARPMPMDFEADPRFVPTATQRVPAALSE